MTSAGAQIRDGAKAFLTWWRGELEALLPPRLLAWFRPAGDRLILEFTASELVVRHEAKNEAKTEGRQLGRFPCDLTQELGLAAEAIEKVEHLIRELDMARVQVRVLLPASQALRRVLTLPAAAEKDLRQALRFEMDRLTPFSADEAYFDFAVIERDRQAKQVRVELVVLARSIVGRALDIVAECGIKPDVVDISWGREAPSRPRNFLAGTDGPRRLRLVSVANLALIAVAIMLLAGVLYLPVISKRMQLADLEAKVEEAMNEANAGRMLQEKIDELGEQNAYIYRKKINEPKFIEVLDEATKVLPDGTWLFRLRYVEGELQIFGNSAAASVLIGRLEKSPLFEQVVFRAPVTRDQRVDAERFHIAADVIEVVER